MKTAILLTLLLCLGVAPLRADISAPETAKEGKQGKKVVARHLVTVTDDFVVEAYKNGKRIEDAKRVLLNEIFGATVERMDVEVRPGDWLVFHVVNNHLRWGGREVLRGGGNFG